MIRPLSDDELDEPLPGLTERAFQWLVELHSGSADPARWEDYQCWCDTSTEHQQAAATAEHLWKSLGSALQRPSSRRRPMPLLGLIAVLGLGAGLAWQGQQNGWMADQRTGMGERRTLELADGSRLELAPQSRVDIDLGSQRRVVRLYTGELFIQVAPDAQRPFEVEAAGGAVRALGTAFDVRRDGATVQVAVSEHAVSVTTAGHQAVVKVGEGLAFDQDGMSAPHPLDVQGATAWRRDRLVFDNRPLGEVLGELARYQSGLVWVRGKRLNDLPVTGIFDTHHLDTQLSLLQKSLPIRIRHLPWLTIIEHDETRL